MEPIFFVIGLVCACFTMYLLPKPGRKYILLFASILFFLLISPSALLYLAAVTGISFLTGRILEKNHKKWPLAITTTLILLLLAGFKYAGLFSGASFAVPLGLSYYSLMVIGSMVEIYRGTEPAPHSLIDYTLFVCFFPQTVAGPIGRSRDLLRQYREPILFQPAEIEQGFAMVLLGLFEKMVLSDNINLFVTGVCNGTYTGTPVILAMLLYSFVIYFDFGGYSLIAIGGARMLGIRLMDNFNAPYLATSVQDFWRRWHISLSSWFRDYVYIPLGGSRKGSLRRDGNTLLVFILSGAWHGAAAGYLIWGALHGLYLVAGKRSEALRERLFGKLRKKRGFPWVRRILIYLLVSLAWVPFWAGGLRDMGALWQRMFTFPLAGLAGQGLTSLGLNLPTMLVCALGTLLVFFLDMYQQKHTLFHRLTERNGALRLGLYLLLFTVILLAGAYGTAYKPVEFIYGQF
ncbi:MAG: MBOAT family protein [Lachnospiraceae bacterium]|nr:MBOAT family protein [Lachnospiraceae bacterium]